MITLRAALFAAMVISAPFVAHCRAATPVGKFVKVAADDQAMTNVEARVGDLLIFSVHGGSYPGGMIEHLQIAVAGESVENVGVWTVPSIDAEGRPTVGGLEMSAFLKAARRGQSVVVITPVGPKGAVLDAALAKPKKFTVTVKPR